MPNINRPSGISSPSTRREWLQQVGLGALLLGMGGCANLGGPGPQAKRRILFFSKSAGFEHSAIKRKGDSLSFAEQVLSEIGPKNNFEFTFSKDGSLFTPKYLDQFDAFFFYTTGDLTTAGTDKNPPMTPEGKQAFIDAVKGGKGFIGSHSASDTYHTKPDADDKSSRYHTFGDKADPYIKMLGGEFIKHGPQQKAKMTVVDHRFPGFEKLGDSFELNEEWYSLKEFQPNLHVLLVQETEGMKGNEYQRGNYPATWAHTHGKGRVFYTSMGHREDVWTNPLFQDLVIGGLSWATRKVDADITPNLEKVAPKYGDLPPLTPPAPAKPAPAVKK